MKEKEAKQRSLYNDRCLAASMKVAKAKSNLYETGVLTSKDEKLITEAIQSLKNVMNQQAYQRKKRSTPKK